jgi:superfamily I DNA and/or RNA helicase
MIALKLQAEGKKMAVITPYDAQRSKIENMFKEQNIQGVPAHNVDSYQGK